MVSAVGNFGRFAVELFPQITRIPEEYTIYDDLIHDLITTKFLQHVEVGVRSFVVS